MATPERVTCKASLLECTVVNDWHCWNSVAVGKACEPGPNDLHSVMVTFVSICRSTRLGGSARPVLCRRVLREREDTYIGKVDFTRRRARWWLFWRTIAIGLTTRLLLPASSFSESLAVPWGLMLSLFRRLRPAGRTLSIGCSPTRPSLSLSSCVVRRSQPTEETPLHAGLFWAES